jgi:hypothetical protein
MFSGYTDVFNVQADSAKDAVKKWTDDQFNIAGIMTDVRYGKVIACKLEHFKPGNVKADNAPVNTSKWEMMTELMLFLIHKLVRKRRKLLEKS